MDLRDNYAIQANQAKATFLTYDQEAIIRKLKLKADETWLYTAMLSVPYRLNRRDGHIQRFRSGAWEEADTFEEVMTLLDLVCDSAPHRHPAFRWKSMGDFGLLFHRTLLEERDPWADYFESHVDDFCRACLALGGKPLPQGDAAYAMEFFDGLEVALQLWLGDEDFPPNLRTLWDENALQYLKYETMYFARSLLLERLREEMENG